MDTPTLFATLDAVEAKPELAKFQFRARNTWVERHAQPQRRSTASTAPVQEDTHPDRGLHLRRRPPGRAGRHRQRADAGRVPAARDRRLPDRRPGQHRRGPRRHAAAGDLDCGGRHRPARHPRPVRRGPQRLPADPGRLRDRRRRHRRASWPGWSSSPAAGRPSTTCSPTAPTSSSTSSRASLGRRPEEEPCPPSRWRLIGAGQAGLAVSRCSASAGVDHVVLERGRVGERWRAATWQSLRLLTPNWLSRLPGWSYAGPDPDGFMTAGEVAGYLGGYAASLPAPVVEHAEVRSVRRQRRSPTAVVTGAGTWTARRSSSRPAGATCRRVPDVAADPRPGVCTSSPPTATAIPPTCRTAACWSSARRPPACSSPTSWREPAVESSSLSGSHTRLPRRYRGRDIMRWLDALGRQPPQPRADARSGRVCGSRRCSWPAGPTTATCTWPRCRTLGVSRRRPARAAPPGTGSPSPPTFPPPPPPRTSGSGDCSARIDRHAGARRTTPAHRTCRRSPPLERPPT